MTGGWGGREGSRPWRGRRSLGWGGGRGRGARVNCARSGQDRQRQTCFRRGGRRGLEEFVGVRGALGFLADSGGGGDDENRQMIAAALFGVENIIAEAQSMGAWLAAELEYVERAFATGREELNRIAVALSFEESPDCFHLHEERGLGFHGLDVVEQAERLRIALGQELFEIAFESEMTAVEHVGIDVAPDFGQVGDVADAPVEIGGGRDGDVRTHPRATRFGGAGGWWLGAGVGPDLGFSEDWRPQALFPLASAPAFV